MIAAVVLAFIPALVVAAPLRVGDHVSVTVFNHPELSLASTTIDGDGDLTMPLAGNVPVAGLEPTVAATHIGAALTTYLRVPVVSLSMLQQNATISIVGGPTSSLPYVPGQTLSSLASTLAATPGLDLRHVSIARDGARIGTYDALDLLQRAEPGPALQPGDRVTFAQKPIAVTVAGIVKSPGPAYLDRGASVADAVYAAGGAGTDAAIGLIDLLRDGQHRTLALATDAATVPAQSGDVITVPQALHIAVTGRVAHPGDTPLIDGTTLFAAIYQAGGPVQYGDVSHTLVVHDGVKHVYDITRVPTGDRSQNPPLASGDVVFVPTGGHVAIGDIFTGANIVRFFLP